MHIVNPWMIYLITRCDAILVFALVTAVISGGATIICLFGRIFELDEDIREGFKKAFKTCMTYASCQRLLRCLSQANRPALK
jgi:hypothetical protein